jgi:aspartokinase
MNILKFGGSSVATPARIKSVIEILKPYLTRKQMRGRVLCVWWSNGYLNCT